MAAAPLLGVWIYDAETATTWANETFAELYSLDGDGVRQGIPRAQFIRRLHPADADRVVSRFDVAIAKAGFFSESYQLRSNDGSGRFILEQGDHLRRGGRTIFCGTSVELDHSQFTELGRGNSSLDKMADHCLTARKIAEQMDLKVERHLLDMTLMEVARKLAAATKRKLRDWH